MNSQIRCLRKNISTQFIFISVFATQNSNTVCVAEYVVVVCVHRTTLYALQKIFVKKTREEGNYNENVTVLKA